MKILKDSNAAIYEGQEVSLTPTEFKLLNYLVEHYPDWCVKDTITEDLWGTIEGDYDPVTHYVSEVRSKLGKDIIQTSRFKDRVAYRLAEETK